MSSVIKLSQYKEVSVAPERRAITVAAASTDSAARDESVAVVDEAMEKAKKIMESANEYSLRRIKETKDQLDAESKKIKQQSYDEGFARGMAEGKKAGTDAGYKDGYEKGLSDASEESRRLLGELSRMIQTVETDKAQILQTFENDLLRLSLSIAEKVIKKELSLDRKIMALMIKSAMDSYRDQSWVRITVPPDTAEELLKADNNIIEALASVSENVKVIPNPAMEDTECLIELPEQIVDPGVDTQLENIRSAIDAALQK